MTVDEIGWFAAGFYPDGYFAAYLRQIEHFKVAREKKIEQLSKGMKAKVALALALAHDPKLLILDEPTSGLDPLVRREFLESMVDRAATGKTVFLASHQINEVERVADYVALMHAGRIVVVEKLDELKQRLVQLSITVREPFVPLPDMNGHVVRSYREGRQWQALMRDVSDEQISRLRANDYVDTFETKRPSLEDIYVPIWVVHRQLRTKDLRRKRAHESVNCISPADLERISPVPRVWFGAVGGRGCPGALPVRLRRRDRDDDVRRCYPDHVCVGRVGDFILQRT